MTERRVQKKDSLQEILDFCENNYVTDISISSVAAALHRSRSYISHIFSNKININFRDYINSLRLNMAKNLLATGDLSITEVASKCGFSTIRTFNRAFRKLYGVSPTEFRNTKRQ